MSLGARTPGGHPWRPLSCLQRRSSRPPHDVGDVQLALDEESPKSLPQGGARDHVPRPPAPRQSPRSHPATRPQRRGHERGHHHRVTPVSPCGKWSSDHLSPAPLQTPSSHSARPWTRGGSQGPSSEELSVCHQIRATQDGEEASGGDPEDLQGDRREPTRGPSVNRPFLSLPSQGLGPSSSSRPSTVFLERLGGCHGVNCVPQIHRLKPDPRTSGCDSAWRRGL